MLQVWRLETPSSRVVRWLMFRAWLWARLGRSSRVVNLARRVLERGRGDKFVEVWAGQMLARYGEPEEAVAVYCASEGLPAGSFEGYLALGHYLLGVGKYERAVRFLSKVFEIRPGEREGREGYLQALIVWLLFDELKKSRRLLLSWRSRHSAADTERWKKHWERAHDLAAALVAEEPEIADRQHALGTCLWHLGRHEEALAHYREAVRLDPEDEQYAESLRAMESLLGRLARKDER